MKHTRKYVEAVKKILPDTPHSVDDAFKLIREISVTKLDAIVRVAMRLNVDPRKADQLIRGTVSLPHGIGKTMRVLVLAVGEKAAGAQAVGADEVSGNELIEKVSKGYTGLDMAVATPNLMGKVGRLGKVLGPRSLMPNPKTGMVTMDVAKAARDIKDGRIKFRVDKHANLQFVMDKVSFDAEKPAENYRAAFEEVMHLHPSAAKGRYITKATASITMGPSAPLVLAEKKEA